nr:hypothetical protein CFP56_22403 [Quercus suber]
MSCDAPWQRRQGRDRVPVEVEIIDLEAAVRGGPMRLLGTQVGAEHLGVGVLVGHVQGPDAGAGAQVEDLLGVLEGAEVQLAVHLQQLVVVFDVHAVQLLLVVGEVVAAGLVGMVPPAVLELVSGDGGHQRGAAARERVTVPAKGAVVVILIIGFHDCASVFGHRIGERWRRCARGAGREMRRRSDGGSLERGGGGGCAVSRWEVAGAWQRAGVGRPQLLALNLSPSPSSPSASASRPDGRDRHLAAPTTRLAAMRQIRNPKHLQQPAQKGRKTAGLASKAGRHDHRGHAEENTDPSCHRRMKLAPLLLPPPLYSTAREFTGYLAVCTVHTVTPSTGESRRWRSCTLPTTYSTSMTATLLQNKPARSGC